MSPDANVYLARNPRVPRVVNTNTRIRKYTIMNDNQEKFDFEDTRRITIAAPNVMAAKSNLNITYSVREQVKLVHRYPTRRKTPLLFDIPSTTNEKTSVVYFTILIRIQIK